VTQRGARIQGFWQSNLMQWFKAMYIIRNFYLSVILDVLVGI
jgi:hypothetical protein